MIRDEDEFVKKFEKYMGRTASDTEKRVIQNKIIWFDNDINQIRIDNERRGISPSEPTVKQVAKAQTNYITKLRNCANKNFY